MAEPVTPSVGPAITETPRRLGKIIYRNRPTPTLCRLRPKNGIPNILFTPVAVSLGRLSS